MSFDLAIWHEESVAATYEADEIYERILDGDRSILRPSREARDFYAQLTSAFPDLDSANMHDSPWAAGIYVADGCVVLAVSWSRVDEILPIVLSLASRCGLVVYDPQSREVHSPA